MWPRSHPFKTINIMSRFYIPTHIHKFNYSITPDISQNAINQLLAHLFSKKNCYENDDFINYQTDSSQCCIAKIFEKTCLVPRFFLPQFSQSIEYISISISFWSQCWNSSSDWCWWSVPFAWKRHHVCTNHAWLFFQHLTQMIILSLCTVSILNLDLQILSINGFHLIGLIVHTTSLCLIIVLLLLLYTQVFLWVQYFSTFVQYLGSVLCFSICILCLCMLLLTDMLSYTIHLPITYKYRCLLKLTKCPKCTFSTTKQNSCLLPQKKYASS